MYKNILKWQTRNSYSDSSCYLKLYFDNLVKDIFKTIKRDLTNNFEEQINYIKENIEFLNLKYNKIIFTETIDFMWALTYVILTYGKIDTSNEINEKTNLYRVFYLPGDKINDTISKRDNLNDIFSSTSIGGPYYRFDGFSEDRYPVGYKVCAENFLCIYNYIFSFDSNSYMIDSELEIGYLFLDKLNLITLDDIEFPYDIKKEKIQDILSNIEKNYINDDIKKKIYTNVFLTNVFCNTNTFNKEMNHILINKLFEKNHIELNLDIKYFNSGQNIFTKNYTGSTFEALYSKEEEKNKMLEFLNNIKYFENNSNKKKSNNYEDIEEIYKIERYKFDTNEFLKKTINYNKFSNVYVLNNYIRDIMEKLSIDEILKKIESENIKNKEGLDSNEFYKKIFQIQENNGLRHLNNDKINELVDGDSKFLFKKRLIIENNSKITIDDLSKKYNFDEKEKYNLESYKKFLLNGFLENYLNFIVSEKKFTKYLYSSLDDEIFYSKFFKFKNSNLFDLNFYLFPSTIYQNFYYKYLDKCAIILPQKYLQENQNFKLKDLSKYYNFEKTKRKDVLEKLNDLLINVNEKNEDFDIINEYFGKEYLFKNLIKENEYNNCINLEKERKDDVKKFCDNILKLEKRIIDDYKNELILIDNIIDAFFNEEYDELSVAQRIDKLFQKEEYNDFLKSLINEEKGEKINENYSFTKFIYKLSKKINSINYDLKNISEYKNFTDFEENYKEVNNEINKINNKLNKCNTKFYKSTYFKNLLETYSKKIEFLEKLYKEFLENEDGEEIYNKYCISNKDIDKDSLDKIFKDSKITFYEKNNNINDLKTLHKYIKESLCDIKLEGYKKFEEYIDFKEKINEFTITSEKEEEDLRKKQKKEEEKEEEESSFEQQDEDDNYASDRD